MNCPRGLCCLSVGGTVCCLSVGGTAQAQDALTITIKDHKFEPAELKCRGHALRTRSAS
jgi:hypothetical protein